MGSFTTGREITEKFIEFYNANDGKFMREFINSMIKAFSNVKGKKYSRSRILKQLGKIVEVSDITQRNGGSYEATSLEASLYVDNDLYEPDYPITTFYRSVVNSIRS
ncbi:MAG: hypothetical protein AABW81_01320 [Nanoarchaeota archaeon]